ncbi:MAG: ribonuclease P protein component [bacterium]|nr:ribonuclease P protein component [bacterium]
MRKVGGAADRNRHRRKLKEFYRLNKNLWPDNTHYYVLFRKSVPSWAEFEVRLAEKLMSL